MNLDQIGSNGTKMEQKWNKNPELHKMEPKCFKILMKPRWNQNRIKMKPKCYQNRTKME